MQAPTVVPEDFEQFRVSADELVEEGDTIVVLWHLEGKIRNDVKLPGVEVGG